MGKDNRLVVGDVLKSSAAERAGLEPGDIVQRYDGERIFNKKELRTATTQGKSGSTVAVDVERDGSLQRFYLPRGPLGITLETVSLPPSSR
jgi:S1-C subfamily serine protease